MAEILAQSRHVILRHMPWLLARQPRRSFEGSGRCALRAQQNFSRLGFSRRARPIRVLRPLPETVQHGNASLSPMIPVDTPGRVEVIAGGGESTVRLEGAWTLAHFATIEPQVQALRAALPERLRLDLDAVVR